MVLEALALEVLHGASTFLYYATDRVAENAQTSVSVEERKERATDIVACLGIVARLSLCRHALRLEKTRE
jgi:hypothetical protein